MDLETRAGQAPHVTKEDIKKGLCELGLSRGHAVGTHSSLSSFGHVAGGADTVLDALLETVGPRGTVVVPAYSSNLERLELTEEDKALGVVRKRRYLPYDPKTDSCWTGKIPDTFWRRKEAVRGTNPTHSLAAIGAKANELSQGWDRLLEADGYILLLGVTLGCCSSMHLAEKHVTQLPRSPEPPGPLKELMQRYEAEGVAVDVEYPGKLCYPDFVRMEGPCEEHGIMKVTRIGEATVKLLRLRELIELYAEHLRESPHVFYHTRRK